MPVVSKVVASTHVRESRVIEAPVERVWEQLRPLTFEWLAVVKSHKLQGKDYAEVGSQRTITYKDGTVQTLKVLELSDYNHYITFELIASEPAISVTSAIHTIRLHSVTFDNSTLVEWVSDFSNDATQEVVQDSKFKKLEAFQELIESVSKKRSPSSPLKKSPKKTKA